VLSVNELVFHANGTLQMGAPTDPYFHIVADSVVFQDGRTTCTITVPSPAPTDGRPGTDSAQGVPGGTGGDAGNPKTIPPFYFEIRKELVVHAQVPGNAPLEIVARGVSGGQGGHGGRGGAGAAGQNGQPGVTGSEPR
jgi:hypothetical protein